MLIIRLNKPIRLPHSIVVVHYSFNSWALAIKKASSSSSPLQALQLYSQLQRQSLPVDSFSILFALKSCSHFSHGINIIRHLHAHLCKLGFGANAYVATALLHAYVTQNFHDARILFGEMPIRNVVTWNVMITGFSRQGDIRDAYSFFEDMPLRDLGSWSAMIAGYMHNARWREGLALFRKMVGDHCLNPNQMIMCSVLSGCGRIGSAGLLLGKSIHGFATKNEWELNVELSTCLIDLYTNYGLLNNAFFIFNMIRDSNVVTWTTLICGAAQNGHGKEALLIFEKMMKSGATPNELTFTGILTACVQAGMVEEGRRYFRMLKECGLRPRIQHYGCMIDLFGKAGLLGDAYEVIKTMPLEPNVVIWSSFLSSCKLHRQFKMAEKVTDQVMRMVRPENDGGVYSLISDLYVLSGKWSEAESLRQFMCNENVRKVRGSSCITSGVL
ncbi:pentatricopeptide repeat-containing protein At1g33350-like [Primulina huaijiensis]|uniref:pentatricopeptide repeat-containing protein At1g33350-like n=1 Tax=Primulina huaijiensis TaxID=1492673 RepID=UPI003CC75210